MKMQTFEYDHHLEVGGHEYEIQVRGTYFPGCKGATDGYGLPVEPDTPEDVELLSIKIKNSLGKWEELPHLEAVEADLVEWAMAEFKAGRGLS